STYILPDEPTHFERFQWLAKEIVDMGGESTLARVKEIEGMPPAALTALFNEARQKDYDEIAEPLTALIKDRRGRKESPDSFSSQVQKLKQRFLEIKEIDYFECSGAEDLQILFQKAESLESPKKKTARRSQRLRVDDYRTKTWLTRPRPEIDRVGSAWLIRKFVDSEAQFVFATSPS